jgi:hypothetical protein
VSATLSNIVEVFQGVLNKGKMTAAITTAAITGARVFRRALVIFTISGRALLLLHWKAEFLTATMAGDAIDRCQYQ